MGKGFQIEESELEGRMYWELPQPARGDAEGCRGWVGTGEGAQLGQASWRPPNPSKKNPTSYRSPKGTSEVWGG